METKVLTKEEITQLTSVRSRRIQLIESFGVLQIQKETLKEELKELTKEEMILGKALQQKYGNGSIDLEKGEFIVG